MSPARPPRPDARAFATAAHAGQLRKGTRFPYIVHPAEVARIVARFYPGRPTLLAAAWLHDTIEDCGVTAGQLSERFGPRVADLVVGLTAPKRESWRATRTATHEKLRTADPDVVRLKVADGLSNTRSMARDVAKAGAATAFAKFRASSPADIAWYHAGIANAALLRLGPEPIVAEYRRVIRSLWPDAPLA